MKIDHFINSELHIVANENINVEQDLQSHQTKSVAELLTNEEKKEEKKDNQKESQ